MPKPGGVITDPIIVNQLLSVGGDGTGDTNAIGNYSSVSETFFIQPANDEVMVLHELLIHIVDAGSFLAEVYGSLAGPLTNGYDVRFVSDSVPGGRSVLPSLVKENADLMHFGIDGFRLINFGGTQDAIIASLNSKNFGTEMILDGSQNAKLEITLNDTFVGLIEQHFIAHGFK